MSVTLAEIWDFVIEPFYQENSRILYSRLLTEDGECIGKAFVKKKVFNYFRPWILFRNFPRIPDAPRRIDAINERGKIYRAVFENKLVNNGRKSSSIKELLKSMNQDRFAGLEEDLSNLLRDSVGLSAYLDDHNGLEPKLDELKNYIDSHADKVKQRLLPKIEGMASNIRIHFADVFEKFGFQINYIDPENSIYHLILLITMALYCLSLELPPNNNIKGEADRLEKNMRIYYGSKVCSIGKPAAMKANERVMREENSNFFESDLEIFTTAVDVSDIFSQLDLLMVKMEGIESKIDDTTAIRLKQAYGQCLDTLFYRFDQLRTELDERYEQVRRLRREMSSTRPARKGSQNELLMEYSVETTLKSNVEDLSSWISYAESAVDALSNEIDQAIHEFCEGNIDAYELAGVLEDLPMNRETTQMLIEIVKDYDCCPELFEALLTERKAFLDQEETKALIEKARKNFSPELWTSWIDE